MENDIEILTRLNSDYVAAVQASDVNRFQEILSDDFRCTNPDYAFLDKAGFLKVIARPVDYSGLTADPVERQIARFAPDFRDCILARSISSPAALEQWNPNLIGGDFLGGAMDIRQLLFRPTASLYRTPLPNLYLCGASTPPGGGVHGMCGYHAAKTALIDSYPALLRSSVSK